MRVHDSTKEKVSFEHCEKEFNNQTNLNTHLKSHELTNKMFSCDNCGKEFKSDLHLRRHLYWYKKKGVIC